MGPARPLPGTGMFSLCPVQQVSTGYPTCRGLGGAKEELPSPALRRPRILFGETACPTRRHEAMPEQVAG